MCTGNKPASNASHDSAMCTGDKPASNASHVGAMWAGSVDVAFNIVDDSIKLHHKFETLYWGISSVG